MNPDDRFSQVRCETMRLQGHADRGLLSIAFRAGATLESAVDEAGDPAAALGHRYRSSLFGGEFYPRHVTAQAFLGHELHQLRHARGRRASFTGRQVSARGRRGASVQRVG